MPLSRSRECFTDRQVGGADRRQKLMTHGRVEPLACLRRHRCLRELAAGGKGIAEQSFVLVEGGRQPL